MSPTISPAALRRSAADVLRAVGVPDVPVPASVLDDLAALAGSLGLPDPRSLDAAPR